MTEEAMDQGGVLTQEDLARLLQTGVRTIRRDVAQLRAEGHWVPTRGAVQDTGRGQSHKAKIVEIRADRLRRRPALPVLTLANGLSWHHRRP